MDFEGVPAFSLPAGLAEGWPLGQLLACLETRYARYVCIRGPTLEVSSRMSSTVIRGVCFLAPGAEPDDSQFAPAFWRWCT